jgi:P2-related tail formation protein
MAELTIQPSINDLRARSLIGLVERIGQLDLSDILVYRLDSVPESALILLAWQFDMLAPQWQLGANIKESIDTLTNIDALSDVDTLTSIGGIAGPSDFDSLRSLLQVAIPLHRTRGTPYSIKAALASMGWGSATLQEGQSSWGGTSYPAAQGWAVFRVLINLDADQAVAAADTVRATAAVNFFKPMRSRLDSLWFVASPIVDIVVTPTDFIISLFKQRDTVSGALDVVSAAAWQLYDLKVTAPLYDMHFYHAGIRYGGAQPAVVDSGVVINDNVMQTSD